MPVETFFFCSRCRKIRPPYTLCPQCGEPLHREPLDFLVGQTIDGYRVEGMLGAGAVGVVYRVRAQLGEPQSALKLMFPDPDDENAEQRFVREAHVLQELKHPNIVRASKVGTSEWGLPYYTMDCLEGRTLRDVMRGLPRGMPLPEALEHARQLGAGLQYAHTTGVIHRDLKPENVLVVPTGKEFVDKLLDFGFAKWVAGRRQVGLTGPGIVVGTPTYLTPEQVGVARPGPATDQYALALVVAELLTGRKMRQGVAIADIVTKEVSQPIPAERLSDRGLPGHVVRALRRATERMPEDRFSSVAMFVRTLEGGSTLRRLVVRRRTTRRAWIVGIALLVFAAVAVALWLLLGGGF
jgi:serine/threonine protein kinase